VLPVVSSINHPNWFPPGTESGSRRRGFVFIGNVDESLARWLCGKCLEISESCFIDFRKINKNEKIDSRECLN
jgi:hypothetical protein